MERQELQKKLYLSTTGADCRQWALRYGLGLELASFCVAETMDHEREQRLMAASEQLAEIRSSWFHAPFAELSPAAIDPRVREVTLLRYRQSIEMSYALGISRLVIHSGYIPLIYFPEWFLERSVEFWREFLAEVPQNVTIALENVMEPSPQLLIEIVQQVDDPRFGLCLDIGHANTRVSETLPMQWIEPMAPWLKHVHLHNNRGDWDLHDSLGQGTVPMERVLDTLLSTCPAVDYTIENQCCAPSVEWLRLRGYLEEL